MQTIIPTAIKIIKNIPPTIPPIRPIKKLFTIISYTISL